MKKLIYIAVALFVLVGCNKEEVGGIQNDPANYGTITGKIELPQDEDAKVGVRKIVAPEGWAAEESPFTMQWESTDKIYIYNDSQSKQLTLKSIDQTTGIATFEGELLDDMSEYKVAYGYEPKPKGTPAGTEFTVPYVEGNYRPFANGTGTGYNFTINNFGPVIGLKLKGTDVLSKIKVNTMSPTASELGFYTMTFSTPLALNTTTAATVYFPIRTSAPQVTLYFKKTVNSEDVTIMTKQLPKAPATNKVTTFSELTVADPYNGHAYVDMGLSVMWATMNVGATTPEGLGYYVAWGETEPKTEYTWDNYKWCKGYDSKKAIAYLTKYCANSTWGDGGFTDDKKTLEPEDDAAHVHWGGGWRTPTQAEWAELMNEDNCTWEETEQNGVPGDLVTSIKTGNSIFLPKNRGEYGGAYWSSSLYYDDSSFSNGPFGWEVRFYPITYYGFDYEARRAGCGIRPVCK